MLRCRDARFVTTCTAANRTFLIEDVERFNIRRAALGCGRILSVGRLVPKKGFDVLLRACGELRRRGIDFDLRIVGGGELHDELLILAEQEGIADRVRLVGSRPNPSFSMNSPRPRCSPCHRSSS
jgi:glycosyltransferase involved in cell wall biosynthesis